MFFFQIWSWRTFLTKRITKKSKFLLNMLQALSVTICSDTVLLFEPRMSHPALRVTRMKNWFSIERFLLIFLSIFNQIHEKSIFFTFFTFFIFFSKNVKKFVRIFDLAITYRRTRDPRQINHSKKLFPNINSNRNLSGWSLIKNWHFKRKSINMLQALWMQTFLTPYYSSSREWDILSYESLR